MVNQFFQGLGTAQQDAQQWANQYNQSVLDRAQGWAQQQQSQLGYISSGAIVGYGGSPQPQIAEKDVLNVQWLTMELNRVSISL